VQPPIAALVVAARAVTVTILLFNVFVPNFRSTIDIITTYKLVRQLKLEGYYQTSSVKRSSLTRVDNYVQKERRDWDQLTSSTRQETATGRSRCSLQYPLSRSPPVALSGWVPMMGPQIGNSHMWISAGYVLYRRISLSTASKIVTDAATNTSTSIMLQFSLRFTMFSTDLHAL
jgi:hypothetical protein